MDIIIFSILSVVYLLLGLFSVTNFNKKKQSLKWFIILTVLLPFTRVTIPFHFKSQVSVYYFFFIGIVVVFFIRILLKRNINKKVFDGILLILSFLSLFLIHFFLISNVKWNFINLLKDLKPFFLLIIAYIFVDYYKESLHEILTEKFCNYLIFLNFLFSSLFFYLMIKFDLHLILTVDPYFKYEELRYETLGTFFGIFFLLFSIFNNNKISFINLILIIITTSYTGNRTLILSVILVVVLYFLTKVSVKKIIVFITFLGVFISGFYYSIINSEESSPLFRFKKMLDLDYIMYALKNRFSPFIIAIDSFNFFDFIFGKGFGFEFFIPWFVWRKNINNYNIYIDNLYLTLYAKYGIFFIIVFLMLYHYLKSFSNRNVYSFYFMIILILSITNAIIFQYNFLFLLVILILNFNLKKE